MSQWNWNNGLANYFNYLTNTLELTLSSFDKKSKHRAYCCVEIQELMENLQNGELNAGDFVRIKGIYSEFVPILNISLLFPDFTPLRPANKYTTHLQVPLVDVPKFSLPLRFKPIGGIGLAGLFNKGCNAVYEGCVPVFYDRRLFKSQKETTGHIVEMEAKIINIPERWSKLFVDTQFLKYTMKGQNMYAGLFMHKFKTFDAVNKFFTDFWRLDYFPFNDPDEDCYEFYELDLEHWPTASKNLIRYLFLLQHDAYRQRRIMSFGILPKVNLVNSNIMHTKRGLLKEFYSYIYKRSKDDHTHNVIPLFSFGHGMFDPNKFKEAITVFQYDQVSPVLSQEFNFND